MKTIRNLIISVIVAMAVIAVAAAEDFKYESHGKRDPFVPLIGQEKDSAVRLIDITAPEDLKLEGIAMGADGKSMAIINGEMTKVGLKVGEIEIKNITANTVELLFGGKPYSLKLAEEGGPKSE